jgi:hypothetical protein
MAILSARPFAVVGFGFVVDAGVGVFVGTDRFLAVAVGRFAIALSSRR